jgi:hypothetical protein
VTATQINWNWGSNTNVNFDAASDTIDFGWFQADQFTMSEVNGTVVIAIPSNQQTYTLQHTTLARPAPVLHHRKGRIRDRRVDNRARRFARNGAAAASASGASSTSGAAAASGHARRRCGPLVGEQCLHRRNDRDGKRHHVQSQLVDAGY